MISTTNEMDQSSIWHPFTQMQTAPPPIPISRGKGIYLYSEDGAAYLDAISSWWVNLHGHSHPYIVEKISQQASLLEHVIFADFTHAPAAKLGSRLLSILPGRMDKIFYSDNGSTAVEVALKMALQYWHLKNTPRKTIICFHSSYHGDTFGAMSAAGKNPLNRPFWSHLFDVETIDPPFKGNEKRSLEQLEAILEKNATACFLFEPLVLGVGGMRIYPSEGLNALLFTCKKYGVLTIADEVMTGFGRTGPLFASERLTEKPDLICLSKGLTGGFLPLGATACTKQIYEAFLSEKKESAFLHGHSYTGNPLACTAALASLDLLLDPACQASREQIAAHHQAFCEKWESHPRVKRCECLGTLLALEFNEEKGSYFHPKRDALYAFFLKRGILLRPLGNVVYVMPPYCIQPFELKKIYQTMEEAVCTL